LGQGATNDGQDRASIINVFSLQFLKVSERSEAKTAMLRDKYQN
jgi:hypothetical protein